MREIPLRAIPNQQLAVTLDGVNWVITLKAARSMMISDIQRDRDTIVQGNRLVANASLIPYAYLSPAGNFALLTENHELPWWEKFESTQTLIYWRGDDRSAAYPAGN
ncbi:phage baseplate plug family protein [Xenorhabdus szentirmaii]|uniref:Cyanophage baseplate Pam3 plug gp18 domain-containing protein n=1 Tax=Xenorhabdus szentirmaii DSM 16338 TaxID=1427518 RepID=W1J424_9GAMM|nr:hypothetical protein [Xenorhabdus szentirmaii]PHM32141.1 phage related-protein [Xenorhabdus szentirmaii DSM 16338]PHM41567.1 phage related-protein [Xenorhabdus szentirmaii]CDL85464.1 conserved hypothetical protein [Xenorhabdus szentirmaii DSM 16338]